MDLLGHCSVLYMLLHHSARYFRRTLRVVQQLAYSRHLVLDVLVGKAR